MLKVRSLGQQQRQEPIDWKGVWAAGAFLAVAYFFIKAPETPDWVRRQ